VWNTDRGARRGGKATMKFVLAKLVFGSSMALGLLMSPHATAGPIQEDDPRWSCVDDGNRVCGPGNSNGVPAGRYDAGGVLVTPWSELSASDIAS
jgi:hypothetical protein